MMRSRKAPRKIFKKREKKLLRKQTITILLTGTIDVSNVPYVTITDPIERLKDYIKSIIMWIACSKASTIVFCENSNFKYDYTFLYRIANFFGKKLEIISFDGNYISRNKGKGYGEGLIIKHALLTSKFLKESYTFYKVTGRLFVKNFDIITKLHEKDTTVFNKTHIFSKAVDTRFFKVNINFYNQYLIDAYKEVDDTKGIYLEHVFYKKLHGLSLPCFKCSPIYVGRSGSTGEHYLTPKWKVFLKDILHKFRFYRV